METLMVLLVILGVFVVFDLAAWLWGADSRDSINSAEWERRQHWKGFGGDGHCAV